METKIPVLFVISLAVGATMWMGSGISGELVSDPTDGLSSPDELESQANDSAIDGAGQDDGSGGFSGPVGTGDEDDIIGLIVSGSHGIADVFGMVVLLPLELANIGFPTWFAYPIGFATQLLAGVGLIQFATGRVFR